MASPLKRLLSPLVKRLENDKHRAVVGGEGIQEHRLPSVASPCEPRRASRGRSSRPSRVTSTVRSSEAASGKLHVDQQIALVLNRHEAARARG